MLKSFCRLLMKLVRAVVPAKMISTFMGMGHLPAWQEHWTALAVLFFAHVLCYIVCGSPPVLANAAFSTGLVLAPFFLQISVLLLFLGAISIFVMSGDRDVGVYGGDTIVIQVAFGQLLTAALSMPATVALYDSLMHLYNKVCSGIFLCPLWFNYFMHLLVFFLLPFVFFNVVILIKPWPMSILQLRYSNCVSIMSEGVVLAFYSLVVMYMTAFICVSLQVSSAVKYMGAVFDFALAGPRAFIG
ncbi:phosphatidylglycerophosphatase [Candidatus Anaplasma sp. TIGMIC]|nr:phosphatidylglycerophosphatase [Candidatus Anaplasma sp. TIGMIC]MDB1135062.1 phosphatidylglycerophosphatase [Candidatus Anaplasma sp. TIGMIC]